MEYYRNRSWLDKRYSDNRLSTYQIAELCNCNHGTIWNWLIKLNIGTRSNSESVHLAKANHCNLSNKARQWIDGELLGDGCLISESIYSARFLYTSKHLKYIEYIRDTLKSFGIKQTNQISKHYHKEFDCFTYHYNSLCYVELLPIFKRWYPKGKKIIPGDLKLTPLTLCQEYIGDGHLKHSKNRRPFILLSTDGFLMRDVKWLVLQLNKLGFKSTRQPSTNKIYVSGYSTKQFLNYIGLCPVKCYQYKWSY